jgi:hypothetical protein
VGVAEQKQHRKWRHTRCACKSAGGTLKAARDMVGTPTSMTRRHSRSWSPFLLRLPNENASPAAACHFPVASLPPLFHREDEKDAKRARVPLLDLRKTFTKGSECRRRLNERPLNDLRNMPH